MNIQHHPHTHCPHGRPCGTAILQIDPVAQEVVKMHQWSTETPHIWCKSRFHRVKWCQMLLHSANTRPRPPVTGSSDYKTWTPFGMRGCFNSYPQCCETLSFITSSWSSTIDTTKKTQMWFCVSDSGGSRSRVPTASLRHHRPPHRTSVRGEMTARLYYSGGSELSSLPCATTHLLVSK